MGVKKRFIEMVKSGYPEFDPQNDSVEIEFEGGGDSFSSFHYIGLYPNRDKVEGFNLDNHWNLLFEILDSAEVGYDWNNAGTTGNIKYNEEGEQELAVYTIVSEEHWGEVHEDEDEEVENETEETNG
jgi:hypothetical protein